MLIRVFEMPRHFTKDFLFRGGVITHFTQVDWFRNEDKKKLDIKTVEGREKITTFIKTKNYYRPDLSYLVLTADISWTIGYSAP